MKKIIYDIELYKNHICMNFCYEDNPDKILTLDGINEIKKINLSKYIWIGFNNRTYDHPILTQIKRGLSQEEIYEFNREIIGRDKTDWEYESKVAICRTYVNYKGDEVKENPFFSYDDNIIDLLEICPKMSKCSLKEFGHRLRYPILQNLPYPFDKELNSEEWQEVIKYGSHDIRITYQLWLKLKSEQETREILKSMYNIKLLGGSPNLAEKCILKKLSPNKISTEIKTLKDPGNLKLLEPTRSLFNEFMNHNYKESMPDKMKDIYTIEGLKIKLGVGGLHAFKKPGYFKNCYNYDVTSYYPSLILNCKLGSQAFRNIYQDMYSKRLVYKANKDKRADGLKLILNSIYGKLGDQYANKLVYAPHIMLNVCLLGQFYLIDLIEKLGDTVIYGNTDGIITLKPIPDEILNEFQNRTGFNLECKEIDHLLAKDANSYYAEYKGSGIDFKALLRPIHKWTHNSQAPVIARSVIECIIRGVPIETTINNCIEPFDFMFFVKAKTWEGNKLFLDGVELEDAKIRFFVSKQGKELTHVTKKVNTTIVKGYGIELAMNIEDCNINNINREYYINRAYKLYNAVLGIKKEKVTK